MISLIECSTNKYAIKVHCEEVFNNLLQDDILDILEYRDTDTTNRGIYKYSLGQSTLSTIKRELNQYRNCEILLDMAGIREIGSNSQTILKDLIEQLRKKNNRILIANIAPGIKDVISSYVSLNRYTTGEVYYFGASSGEPEVDCKSFLKLADIAFYKKFASCIGLHTKDYNKKSPSSRVRLSRYVDIKSLMEDEFEFFNLSAYMLALKIYGNNNPLYYQVSHDNRENVCLFIHTMNGALLGAVLSQLLCLDVILVDHLGPSNKVYSTDLLQRLDSDKEYLVVTDVICMGTELSNARTILDVFGAKYKGCITLVNIVPVTPEGSILGENFDQNVYSLYNIDKDNNPIGYTIETDLGVEKCQE